MAGKRRSPGMSGASIDRIDGGGIGKTRSCDLNVSACLLCDTAAQRRRGSSLAPGLTSRGQDGGRTLWLATAILARQ